MPERLQDPFLHSVCGKISGCCCPQGKLAEELEPNIARLDNILGNKLVTNQEHMGIIHGRGGAQHRALDIQGWNPRKAAKCCVMRSIRAGWLCCHDDPEHRMSALRRTLCRIDHFIHHSASYSFYGNILPWRKFTSFHCNFLPCLSLCRK